MTRARSGPATTKPAGRGRAAFNNHGELEAPRRLVELLSPPPGTVPSLGAVRQLLPVADSGLTQTYSRY